MPEFNEEDFEKKIIASAIIVKSLLQAATENEGIGFCLIAITTDEDGDNHSCLTSNIQRQDLTGMLGEWLQDNT